MLRAYAPGRFGQIHYRHVNPQAAGGKPPLLCLHPSPMSSLIFADFLPAMATDRWVIAADTPGYGLSDRPATQPYIPDFAGAMGDLLDGLGITQVDLFGYHTGCATSIELAKQRPSLVRKIVLNSALMFTQQELADLKESFAKRSAPPLDGQIAGLPDRWKHHRAWWRDVPDEDRAWAMFWESNRDIKHSTWGFTAAFANDFAKTLSETKNPLLIFNPQDDLWEMTPRAKGVAPDMRIHDLPGWTHGYLNAHPDEVAALVRDFLDA